MKCYTGPRTWTECLNENTCSHYLIEPQRPNRLCAPPRPLTYGIYRYGGLFHRGVMRPECEAHHSTLSSAEVYKTSSFFILLPQALYTPSIRGAYHKGNFAFTLQPFLQRTIQFLRERQKLIYSVMQRTCYSDPLSFCGYLNPLFSLQVHATKRQTYVRGHNKVKLTLK